jgi:hypothetical protein
MNAMYTEVYVGLFFGRRSQVECPWHTLNRRSMQECVCKHLYVYYVGLTAEEDAYSSDPGMQAPFMQMHTSSDRRDNSAR